jgi:hypothetical protein
MSDASTSSKKSTTKEQAELIEITELVNAATNVNWQKAAFMQFCGYKKGKELSQSDFDSIWTKFLKEIGGSK